MVEKREILVSELIILIRNVIKYLLSKWKLLLLFIVLGGALGVWKAWLTKPKYIATLTFFTEGDSKSALGGYSGLAAQFGLDLGGAGGTAFEGENLIEILHSKTLINKTLLSPVEENSSTLMIDKYLSDHEINKGWKTDEKYKNVKFDQFPSNPDRLRDSILNEINEGIVESELNIQKRDKKRDLIEVTMVSGSENFAKRFIEILTSNAIKYYTDYKVKKSSQNVGILQKQTDSVRAILFGNINDVAVMNDVNVNPLRQIVRTGVQRKQVDVQANSALYGELLKNLELSKLALRKETPLIQVVDQPSLPLKKIKPGRLLTGVIYAFVAGILVTIFILAKLWLIKNNVIVHKNDVRKGNRAAV